MYHRVKLYSFSIQVILMLLLLKATALAIAFTIVCAKNVSEIRRSHPPTKYIQNASLIPQANTSSE